ECPHCRRAYPIVKEVRERLGPRLRFVFRNFPLTELHLHAEHAAEAAEAAGAQGKFWEMHDRLFERQFALEDDHLIEYARELVLGGLVIALLPGLPPVEFQPRLIFVVFIPPLLYRAALTSSWRDLRANVRPIMLLAVGLVVFTTVVVGVAAHALEPGLPWAAA